MKFIVSSGVLLKKLQLIGGVVSSNTVLPILEDFLFEVEGGQLTAHATDLETSMSATVEVDGTGSCRIAVPARLMLDFLKALPEQPITLKVNTDNYSVEITSERGKYRLAGENGEDFPRIPTAEEARELKMASSVLANAINKTLFAVSTDDMRPAMMGVNMELGGEGTTFVATDAHRLVRYRRQDIKSPKAASLIVPRKALQLLAHALPSEETQVRLSYNNSNAFFAFDQVRLICRLIDARYPDYNAVIPTENPNQLTVSSADLLQSLRRLIILSSKSSYQTTFQLSGSSLQITARDIDFSNEGSETLSCRYSGEPMEISFNGKFLTEILTALNEDEVVMRMSTPSRACVITPAQQKDYEDLLMLVMPIMIGS
ncbi:MAG: DNA polymerase III subunit beta [Chitinophagales bacterium]|nr:DNA polymerase III subunit beta [Chitinophagales bacterium]MDW8393793.1 DNA polymerase III subunit beta [Chitinophagales bacterium]